MQLKCYAVIAIILVILLVLAILYAKKYPNVENDSVSDNRLFSKTIQIMYTLHYVRDGEFKKLGKPYMLLFIIMYVEAPIVFLYRETFRTILENGIVSTIKTYGIEPVLLFCIASFLIRFFYTLIVVALAKRNRTVL